MGVLLKLFPIQLWLQLSEADKSKELWAPCIEMAQNDQKLQYIAQSTSRNWNPLEYKTVPWLFEGENAS